MKNRMIDRIYVRRLLYGAAVFFSLGIFASEAQTTAEYPKVFIEEAKSEANVVDKKYVGYVEAIDVVNVQARVSGNIEAMHFREGGMVKKGQLLFEIEDTQYKSRVQNMKAQIAQIDSKTDYAKLTHDRYVKLSKTASVAQDSVDNSKSALTTLNAEKLAAEAELVIAEDNLAYTKILSPIKGRVGRVTYSVGNYVTPQSSALLTITNLDQVYVRFAISERDMMSLFKTPQGMKENAVIHLTLANGSPYSLDGKIFITDNKVRSNTGTLDIWAKFDNPDESLIPGGVVTVHLSRKDPEELPAVLLSAVMHREGKSFIYVLNDKDEIERKDVTLGNILGNRQLLRTGVKAGDRVVVDGMHKTAPGQKVTPVLSHI